MIYGIDKLDTTALGPSRALGVFVVSFRVLMIRTFLMYSWLSNWTKSSISL